jgi:D-alanyl-D-alanine carboxypeptidase (penicillin-binding protein 5/6)
VAGQEIGKIIVTSPGYGSTEAPLVAAANVEKLGFFGRAIASLKHLIFPKS